MPNKFLRLEINGQAQCHLFGELIEKDGWLIRHSNCSNKEITNG
jgi:hypothetical protein